MGPMRHPVSRSASTRSVPAAAVRPGARREDLRVALPAAAQGIGTVPEADTRSSRGSHLALSGSKAGRATLDLGHNRVDRTDGRAATNPTGASEDAPRPAPALEKEKGGRLPGPLESVAGCWLAATPPGQECTGTDHACRCGEEPAELGTREREGRSRSTG